MEAGDSVTVTNKTPFSSWCITFHHTIQVHPLHCFFDCEHLSLLFHYLFSCIILYRRVILLRLSSSKKNSAGNGSRFLSSILPDRFPQKKRNVHPVNGLPYKQKVGGSGVAGGGASLQKAYNAGQNSVSAFTQRVMSAKLLRVKQLQNQLTDTQNQLNELVNENRLLRTLQKRQAVALQRFEGSQDQLPQLIKSHNEEIRVLNSKVKQLKEKYTDLENRLKRKDAELNYLKEHHRHLLHLTQDKQLVDREKLAKKVETLEAREKEQSDKIQLLTRKLELEGKNYRHQLGIETNKLRETQNDLKSALGTINNLKAALEAKEKYVNCTMPKKYQKSMEHLMQNTHVSLPIPPRVSIRQPDKCNDAALANDEESSCESEVSYSKIFDEKFTSGNVDNRSSLKVRSNTDKTVENVHPWSPNSGQDSKSNSSSEAAKDRKGDNKVVNQSDDSLDGLKFNRIEEAKKKKRFFTNVVGGNRETNSNYSFGNKLDGKYKELNTFRLNELGRVKPRSRSLSRDSKPTHKVNPLKKGPSGKSYFADKESSSDEHHQIDNGTANQNEEYGNLELDSSLASFHREMEYELEQVIKNESSAGSPDADCDDTYDKFHQALDHQDIPIFHVQKQIASKTEQKSTSKTDGSLDRFSKLTWNQMQNEIASKDEILNILEKAHPTVDEDNLELDEDKKANLLKMLNDIDDNYPQDSLNNGFKLNTKIDSDIKNKKIDKAKKKHILEEIFR